MLYTFTFNWIMPLLEIFFKIFIRRFLSGLVGRMINSMNAWMLKFHGEMMNRHRGDKQTHWQQYIHHQMCVPTIYSEKFHGNLLALFNFVCSHLPNMSHHLQLAPMEQKEWEVKLLKKYFRLSTSVGQQFYTVKTRLCTTYSRIYSLFCFWMEYQCMCCCNWKSEVIETTWYTRIFFRHLGGIRLK